MRYEEVLNVYSLSEIIEINGLSEEDVLEFLVEQQMLVLPLV